MPDMRLIDLNHLGRAMVIGAWIVEETYLIDPGPAICLPRLLAELGEWQPKAILVTHIHLDHSGVVGHLLQRWPQTEVWVHQRGAPHLADPSRLLASAHRVYGDQLEPLWGLPQPVPSAQLRIIQGGEKIGPMEVLYTPGHASHHVAFLN
ncbi:MAG: MBL fold metallo-hydrolase, partial [Candidatus Dormibacteraceae bacterium]